MTIQTPFGFDSIKLNLLAHWLSSAALLERAEIEVGVGKIVTRNHYR